MAQQFEDVIARMPLLLDKLQGSPLQERNKLEVPERGVYVFYENEDPRYAGRTNRMKVRLQEHGRPSSKHNSATFAFILAKEEADHEGLKFDGMSRDVIEVQPAFVKLFADAKRRISAMKVRVVEVKDPVEQALFEVYAALKLGTKYNDFENH